MLCAASATAHASTLGVRSRNVRWFRTRALASSQAPIPPSPFAGVQASACIGMSDAVAQRAAQAREGGMLARDYGTPGIVRGGVWSAWIVAPLYRTPEAWQGPIRSSAGVSGAGFGAAPTALSSAAGFVEYALSGFVSFPSLFVAPSSDPPPPPSLRPPPCPRMCKWLGIKSCYDSTGLVRALGVAVHRLLVLRRTPTHRGGARALVVQLFRGGGRWVDRGLRFLLG